MGYCVAAMLRVRMRGETRKFRHPVAAMLRVIRNVPSHTVHGVGEDVALWRQIGEGRPYPWPRRANTSARSRMVLAVLEETGRAETSTTKWTLLK